MNLTRELFSRASSLARGRLRKGFRHSGCHESYFHRNSHLLLMLIGANFPSKNRLRNIHEYADTVECPPVKDTMRLSHAQFRHKPPPISGLRGSVFFQLHILRMAKKPTFFSKKQGLILRNAWYLQTSSRMTLSYRNLNVDMCPVFHR